MVELDQAAVLKQAETLAAEGTEAVSWKAALPTMAALSVLGLTTAVSLFLELRQLMGF
jgi:hypothetical protein